MTVDEILNRENEITRQIEATELVKVNGTYLNDPKPSAFKFSKKELDYDSGRNILGVMERNVLDHHARTLDLTFTNVNALQMATLLNILDHPTLTVECFDPYTGGMTSATMYHGDLNPEVDRVTWDYNRNVPIVIYKDFTVQLVEY